MGHGLRTGRGRGAAARSYGMIRSSRPRRVGERERGGETRSCGRKRAVVEVSDGQRRMCCSAKQILHADVKSFPPICAGTSNACLLDSHQNEQKVSIGGGP